ncbi:MAG TPA: HAMP domain-containing sensor histidine kinase [Chitinolyticbacter sp.]|nr:HAMP domain-containing sensor histidine kinase [Chitinolyticbacter sp.]
MPIESLPRRRSLRWRLAWAFTLLTTLALLAQAIALFAASEALEEDLIDEVVNTALDGVIAALNRGQAPALAPHLTEFHAARGAMPPGLPPELRDFPQGNREWYARHTEYHVGVRDHDGQRYYVLYDTAEHEARLDQLLLALCVGVVVLAALALSLGVWLSGALLRQLDLLARRVSTDATGPLAQPGQDIEVAQLAAALDDARDRNAALIAREREFTANVSHELRTPLTRIRTGAELLADTGDARALRVVGAADELERRLRGLLFLARAEAVPQLEPLRLRDFVAAILAGHADSAAAKGLQLRNLVPDDTLVDADPALLALALDNLVGNAVCYTEHGEIGVGFDAGWLVVRDTGIGIAPELQAQMFERHVRGTHLTDGMGLGLAIVRQAAARCGWACRLRSQPGQGSEFALQLGLDVLTKASQNPA